MIRVALVAASIVIAIGACGRAATPAPAPAPRSGASAPTPAASFVSIPVASTSTSSSPPAASDSATIAEPMFPMPPVPAGADPELVRIASSICAAAYLKTDAPPRTQVGCRRPPPFDEPSKKPDGKIVRHADPDVYTFCGFTVVQRGAFSKPGARELVLSFDNCHDEHDDEGWNGSMPGSGVLVEEAATGFRVVAYALHANIGACKAIGRRDARSALVCRSRYDAGNIGTEHYFFVVDFTRTKRPATTIARLYDDRDLWGCDMHPPAPAPLAPTGLTSLAIASVSYKDTNGDGVLDVLVDVDRAHAPPSPALERQLNAFCKQQGVAGGRGGAAMPPPTRTRITLESTPGGFAPASASKVLLDAWAAESPDVQQLDETAPPAP